MKQFFNKFALFIPLCVLLLLCIVEWCLYTWTPYSYFYSRGTQIPNVDYVATTRGDFVVEDIFATKQPRQARYVTDKYGSRNINFLSKPDVLIFGESFGQGAGIGHKFTPAVQLSELTEYSVVVAPQSYDPFTNKNQIEMALHVIMHQDPANPKFILLIYNDSLLWFWDHEYDFEKTIKLTKEYSAKKDLLSKIRINHIKLKNYISDYSPMTIISRKFKSYIKVKLKILSNYFSIYSIDDKKYLQTDNGTIIFDPIPNEIDISNLNNSALQKLRKLAITHKHLYNLGLQKNIVVIPLIVPDKSFAYYNEINNTDYYSKFPGVILEDYIKSLSLPVVSVYPEFLKAVHDELNNNGNPVYWGDDSHWNGLGIKIAMSKVGEQIKKIDNSVNK